MMGLDMIMSTDLVTVSPNDNLAAARELMHEKHIHHLPVVDDQEIARIKKIGYLIKVGVGAFTGLSIHDQ